MANVHRDSITLNAMATTYTLSDIPDGRRVFDEMARVTSYPGGVLTRVYAGYPGD